MSITENTAGNTAETALVALAGHVDPARVITAGPELDASGLKIFIHRS